MQKLVLQIIIKQWDKSQVSEQHKKAREHLPNRYPISPSAVVVSDGQIILDQHGDDISGNRIRYQLMENNYFLIDRFRIELKTKTIEFKPHLQADEPPIMLTTIKDGWIQCQYQWRYRVDEGGFIYWLYENVIINVCFLNEIDANVFIDKPPQQSFEELLVNN